MKRLIPLFLLITLLLSACSSSAPAPTPTPEPVNYLQKFVDEYNAVSASPLTVVEEFSPHEKGDHYRTEFRLTPYIDSLGLYCTSETLAVSIVNYGSRKAEFRVYADGPADAVISFYRIAAKILDPNVTDEALDKAVDYAINHAGGNGLLIEGSNIEPTILFAANSTPTAEAMLDTRHYAMR